MRHHWLADGRRQLVAVVAQVAGMTGLAPVFGTSCRLGPLLDVLVRHRAITVSTARFAPHGQYREV